MKKTHYKIAVKHNKSFEDGTVRSVTENIVVSATNYIDAETTATELIVENLTIINSDEFSIVNIAKTNISEIVADKPIVEEGKIYKAKASFTTVDEIAGKVKQVPVHYLVPGEDLDEAYHNLKEHLKNTTVPMEIHNIVETNFLAIYQEKELVEEEDLY